MHNRRKNLRALYPHELSAVRGAATLTEAQKQEQLEKLMRELMAMYELLSSLDAVVKT